MIAGTLQAANDFMPLGGGNPNDWFNLLWASND
jgi:hypothetical protein